MVCEPLGFDLGPNLECIKTLGSGSQGMVVRAVHKQMNKIYAVKKISDIFRSVGVGTRYLRELQLMIRARGLDNVVQIHSVIVPGNNHHGFDSLYLVMEHMVYDLRYLLSQAIKLTLFQIKFLIYTMLRGIHSLHSAGIIHRDIKPANVLISKNCAAKICDLGLSRDVRQMPDPYKDFREYLA